MLALWMFVKSAKEKSDPNEDLQVVLKENLRRARESLEILQKYMLKVLRKEPMKLSWQEKKI